MGIVVGIKYTLQDTTVCLCAVEPGSQYDASGCVALHCVAFFCVLARYCEHVAVNASDATQLYARIDFKSILAFDALRSPNQI